MKTSSQNIVAASIGATLALGGFYAINNYQNNATNVPLVIPESQKIQLSKTTITNTSTPSVSQTQPPGALLETMRLAMKNYGTKH